MKKHIFFAPTIYLVLLWQSVSISQTISVFVDDTSFVKMADKQVSGFNVYSFELKEILPDGCYKLFHLNSHDSLRQDSSKLIMSGKYVNGLRDGLFYYYFGPYKVIPNPEMRLQYKHGHLDGFQYQSTFRQIKQATYKGGQLNGLSLVHNEMVDVRRKLFRRVYTYSNYISLIISYANDSVIQWMQMQPEITFVYRNGHGNIYGERCEIEEYDNNGFLKFLYSFEDGFLVRVNQYSSDGLIIRLYNYDKPKNSDQQSQSSYIQIFNEIEFAIVNYTPINGSIEELDPMGRIISRKSFINNVVQ